MVNGLDVFEDLKNEVGCLYISDLRLPRYIKKSRKVLCKLDLKKYSLLQLNDVVNYLYDFPFLFSEKGEALRFFVNQR